MSTVAGATRPLKRLSDTPGLDPKVRDALIQLEIKVEEMDRRLFAVEQRLSTGGL